MSACRHCPRFQATRSNRSLLLVLDWWPGNQLFGNDTDLLKHAQSVGLNPSANDLIVAKLVDNDPLIGHFILSWGNAVKYSAVSSLPPLADRDAISLSDQIFDRESDVGKTAPHRGNIIRKGRRAPFPPDADIIIGNQLGKQLHRSSIQAIFVNPANNLFVLLKTLNRRYGFLLGGS